MQSVEKGVEKSQRIRDSWCSRLSKNFTREEERNGTVICYSNSG